MHEQLIKDLITCLELESKEEILIKRYINQGKMKFKNYLSLDNLKDVDKEEGVEEALFDYVINSYNVKGYEGYKQYNEGGQSVTLIENDGLFSSTKALLRKPIPKVVMK